MNTKKHYIIPVFIPHQGCPHQCIFCNQNEITGQDSLPTIQAVNQTIQDYLATMPPQPKFVEVAFYGGSFTGLDMDLQEAYLAVVQPFLQQGQVQGIRLSTRPDYITPAILKNLQAYQVDTVELGVQSMDEEILRRAARGHTAQEVALAVGLLKEYQFQIGLQMMVGLPGDCLEKALQTAANLIDLRPDFVRIYPVLVIQNTPLAKMYQTGTYIPWELAETVEVCKEVLKVFQANDIAVIRIGLQPTEDINSGGQVLAGPFHPAFGELVESALAKDKLHNLLQDSEKPLQGKTVTFQISPRDESIVRGQRNVNMHSLVQEFELKSIRLVMNGELPRKKFILAELED